MDSGSSDLEWAENRMKIPDRAHSDLNGTHPTVEESGAGVIRGEASGVRHVDEVVRRQGAIAGSREISIEALQMALEQMSVPPCPEALRAVLEETSLERLVYWKLQALFEHFDYEPPTNVLRVVHEHVERPLFSLVLKKTKGNQSRAAEVLGCNRNTLHRKLKSLAIQPSDVRRALKMQKRRKFRVEMESLIDH